MSSFDPRPLDEWLPPTKALYYARYEQYYQTLNKRFAVFKALSIGAAAGFLFLSGVNLIKTMLLDNHLISVIIEKSTTVATIMLLFIAAVILFEEAKKYRNQISLLNQTLQRKTKEELKQDQLNPNYSMLKHV